MASCGRDIGRAVTLASRMGWVKEKYAWLIQFVSEQVAEHYNVDWAIAAEVCTLTLTNGGPAALHFHLLLLHAEFFARLPVPGPMLFESITPHVQAAAFMGHKLSGLFLLQAGGDSTGLCHMSNQTSNCGYRSSCSPWDILWQSVAGRYFQGFGCFRDSEPTALSESMGMDIGHVAFSGRPLVASYTYWSRYQKALQ